MSKTKSPDEQPKKDIAKKVVTAKRRYFVPDYGVSVEAEDAVEASKLAKEKTKRVGDG